MAITRNFKLFLNAGSQIPLLIHANQYDSGEQWRFTLYNQDGSVYEPSSGAIVGIKSDGHGIINTGTVSGGKVVITETQQMTAAAGKAVFELMIDGGSHGTANFIVLVEPKPGDQADLSESDLSLIQEAINSTTPANIASAVSTWMDDNLTPTTPVVDQSLTVQGAAADAKKTGDEISALKSAIESGSSLTSAIKSALLQLAQKVAYIDEDGQDYYDDLYDALYPPVVYTAITLNTNSLSFGALNTTQTLTATTTPSGGAVTWSSSNTSVATVSQTGVVTSVGYGNATITATCGNLSATCSVAITQATVTSISAVFNQVGVTVYSTDTLDSLKAHLTVRATYSDSSTVTLDDSDYTLSGTLTVGTSTITVSYGGQSTTFTVDVTDPYALQWMVEYRGNFTTSTAGTNRVTLISSDVHFEPGDVKTATIAQGYKMFPISESATGSDTSLNRTPKGTNNIYVTTEWGNTTTDSKGKIVVGTTAPVLLSTNTWVQNGGSCSFTYSSEKTTWYTLGGLSFYVEKVDGSDITVDEAEAALTIE